MNGFFHKVTDKIHRYDEPVGMPLNRVPQFHDQVNLILPNGGSSEIHMSEKLAPHKTPQEKNSQEKTYEQGLAEGHSQAECEAEDTAKVVLQMMQELHGLGQEIEASHGRFISAVLHAVLPALANTHAGAEIKAFLVAISAQALHGQVTLQAPPKLQQQLEAALVKVNEEISDMHLDNHGFTVEIDNNNTDHKICASWQNGDAEINIDGAVQTCLDMVKDIYRGDADGSI